MLIGESLRLKVLSSTLCKSAITDLRSLRGTAIYDSVDTQLSMSGFGISSLPAYKEITLSILRDMLNYVLSAPVDDVIGWRTIERLMRCIGQRNQIGVKIIANGGSCEMR